MSNFSSGRQSRLKSSAYLKGRNSNSPSLSSTQSDRSLWARSYKNEPIPTRLRTRLIGKKYQFDDNSDSDEEIMAVMEEEEQEQIEKKKTRLSKFKVISDFGEFSDTRRSGISSERNFRSSMQRCHSVASLKLLPQVEEEKKEDDELRRMGLSKLAQFKDKNEFGQKHKRRSSSEYTEVVSHVESMDLPTQFTRLMPYEIEENDEPEEVKSAKLYNERSILEAEMDKLIVDEVDERKKKKEDLSENIAVIEEEKIDESVDTEKLRQSLSKFESEYTFFNQINDEEDYSKKMDPIIPEEKSEISDKSS